ncbi:MAG: hypothetical protein NZ927_09585 [Candidatus Calescibacterium sp.]|nr:hypothetical protein [Candidatus Calescibacterium sp.]
MAARLIDTQRILATNQRITPDQKATPKCCVCEITYGAETGRL